MRAIDCGHDHSEPLQGLACRTVRGISKAEPGAYAAAVVILEDGEPLIPHSAALGNMTAFAIMVRNLCELALQSPRPADCDQCAANYDRLKLALASLGAPMTRC